MSPDHAPRTAASLARPAEPESDLPLMHLVEQLQAAPAAAVPGPLLSHLVARVYEAAAPQERSRMLEQLIKPLGLLSLATVANGIFAGIRLRGDWPTLGVRLEDTAYVRAGDLVALANQVQQVSLHAVHGLAQMLAASPVLAGSAAAAILVQLLRQRAQARAARDNELDP